MKKLKSRFYQIDFIRTAAFLMIFVSHITRLNHHDNGLGCGGVSLFMILSGFLMFYNHGDEIDGKVSVSGLWRAGVGYYKKGLGKFYKGHIITFVSGALLQAYWLIRWFSVEGFWGAVQTAVPNILLFQSFIPKGEYYFSYNAVSWFLCDILFFYFCFPFLAQMIKRQKIFLGGVLQQRWCCSMCFLPGWQGDFRNKSGFFTSVLWCGWLILDWAWCSVLSSRTGLQKQRKATGERNGGHCCR